MLPALAEGIALAAEKSKLRETYILAGESTSLRQLFGLWAAKPGGFRIRLFVPFWLAALMFVLTEPMQSGLGLPAFISRETVWDNKGSLNFSSAKPQHELGWAHLPVREIWSARLLDYLQLVLISCLFLIGNLCLTIALFY